MLCRLAGGFDGPGTAWLVYAEPKLTQMFERRLDDELLAPERNRLESDLGPEIDKLGRHRPRDRERERDWERE